jgi:hypothetical protein
MYVKQQYTVYSLSGELVGTYCERWARFPEPPAFTITSTEVIVKSGTADEPHERLPRSNAVNQMKLSGLHPRSKE